MGKKRRDPVDVTPSGELTHSPFAALLGADLPPGPAAPEAPPEEAPAADGARFLAKVVVRRERKGRGGKTVTRVSGVTEPHREPVALALKRALGCAASVEGEDVILGGDLVDRAAEWIAGEGARRVVRG